MGLSAEAFGECVERGVVAGLGVAAARGRIRSVGERHARLGAVAMEFHSHDSGLMHPGLWHRVRAHHDQLRLDEFDDLVSNRELNTCSRGASKMRVISTSDQEVLITRI